MPQQHRRLLALAGFCFLIALFPVAPYIDGYTLVSLSPWVSPDTSILETVAWAILLIGPAAAAFVAGLIIVLICRTGMASRQPQRNARYFLSFLLWGFVLLWICALTFQVADIVSGRLTGSELEGWLCAISMYMYPLTAIITSILVLRENNLGIKGAILSSSLNFGLFWFLLLAAGSQQLSPFSWMLLAVTVLATITGLSYITIYRR